MVMTLEADYAVRIVEYLTKHPERRDARTISEETQIPLRFSLKILRELVTEGMVCSFKGAKGGYTLAKSPEEITLRQVIELVEGRYMLSRCQKEEYSCGRAHCRLHSIYEKISEDVRRELGSASGHDDAALSLLHAREFLSVLSLGFGAALQRAALSGGVAHHDPGI